jgi:hypothetical protein
MSSFRTGIRLTVWSGLWISALLWAANMQLGQILPYVDCAQRIRYSAYVSAAMAVLALAAGYASWRSAHSSPRGFGSPSTIRFAGSLSALSALVFVFALIMQAMASVVLTGCER